MRTPSRSNLSARWAVALCAFTLCLAPSFATASLLGLGGSKPASDASAQEKALADVRAAAATAEEEAKRLEQRRQALRAEAANAPARTAALEAELGIDARKSLAEWRRAAAAHHQRGNAGSRPRAGARGRQPAARAHRGGHRRPVEIAGAAGGPRNRPWPTCSAASTNWPCRSWPWPARPANSPRRASLRNAAERRQLVAELALRQDQQDLGGLRQRLQELELRTLRHELDLRTPRLALMQQRIAAIGREELEKLAADVAERAKAYAAREPLVAAAAKENVRLADELVQTNERLANRRRFLAMQDEALARDLAGLRDSVSRVELGGRSEEVGNWLWAELRRLEPEAVLQDELAEVEQTLGELRLRMIGVNELQRELSDPAQAAQRLRAKAPGVDDDGLAVETAEADPLEDLLRERLDLTDRLEPLMWRRITALEQSERSVKARLEANRQLRQTLNRHLLWIRSHPPVDAAWAGPGARGSYDLVKPSRLVTTFELVRRSFAESSWRYVASLALVVVLLLLQQRARGRIDALANVVREVRMRPTLQVLGWTLLAALPWAVALLLAGSLLQDLGTPGKYSDSLGKAMAGVALPTFTLVFLRWLVRERGLAHAHFRWSRPRREALARWTPRLMVGLLPLYFIVALAFIRNQELAITVQGAHGHAGRVAAVGLGAVAAAGARPADARARGGHRALDAPARAARGAAVRAGGGRGAGDGRLRVFGRHRVRRDVRQRGHGDGGGGAATGCCRAGSCWASAGWRCAGSNNGAKPRRRRWPTAAPRRRTAARPSSRRGIGDHAREGQRPDPQPAARAQADAAGGRPGLGVVGRAAGVRALRRNPAVDDHRSRRRRRGHAGAGDPDGRDAGPAGAGAHGGGGAQPAGPDRDRPAVEGEHGRGLALRHHQRVALRDRAGGRGRRAWACWACAGASCSGWRRR